MKFGDSQFVPGSETRDPAEAFDSIGPISGGLPDRNRRAG